MNFRVNDTKGARFALAVERLIQGHPFDFRNLTVGCCSVYLRGGLDVLVRSSKPTGEVTEGSANSDLQKGRELFGELVAESPTLSALVTKRPAEFALIYDYGTGAVELCRQVGEELVWAEGIFRTADRDRNNG